MSLKNHWSVDVHTIGFQNMITYNFIHADIDKVLFVIPKDALLQLFADVSVTTHSQLISKEVHSAVNS